MADIAINPVTRRVQFTGNTGTGPFAFTFNILQASDIAVYKNSVLLTLTTDYTVSINANGTGSVTLTGSASGTALTITDTLTIIGGRELSRTTDFVTSGDLLASSLNEQLDALTIMAQQIDERVLRSIRQNPGDVDGSMTLPLKSDRANKYLKFDANGNPDVLSDLEISGSIIGSNYTADSFSGDGLTTVFALSTEPGSKNNCQVYIDGVYQEKTSFSLSSSTLTFTEAPPNGTSIEVLSGVAVNAGDDATNVTFTQPFATAPSRTVNDKLQESLTFRDFGAAGNGSTDDTAKIAAALAAASSGQWVDGENKTYLISSTITITNSIIRMRNANFVFNSDYSDQGRFSFNAGSGTSEMRVELENLRFTGGRNTYKVGLEPWRVFTSFGAYDSIRPTLSPTINITCYHVDSFTRIKNVNFYDVHSDACLEIGTYGTVFINDCEYRNISNKTFHVYHSPDDGVTQNGQTFVNNVYAQDVGLLPDDFTVDGVAETFAASTSAPQGSFNFIVSHGDFTINNAVVENYCSCGVTADRNFNFTSNNVFIKNTTNRSFSNNPQGAFWLEACNTSNCTNTFVQITDRDSRDIATDGSAVQIYATAGSQTNFSNLVVITNASVAKVNKLVRSSLKDNPTVNINNFYLYGLPASYQNAMSMLLLPNSTVDNDIRITNGYIFHGGVNVERPDRCVVENVIVAGNGGTANITFGPPGNPGVTGTSTDISVKNCTVDGSISCLTIVDGKFLATQNRVGSAINADKANTGDVIVTDNMNIGGSCYLRGASATSGRVVVSNNAHINGTTTVAYGSSAVISGNTTSSRIEVKDVETFTIVGNNARTDNAEPIIWINPTSAANILAGVISSNNILVKTGTVGAGYVTIGGGVSGVTDVNNNKRTVAWT